MCCRQNWNSFEEPVRKFVLAAFLPLLASMGLGQTDAASFAAELSRYNVDTNIVYHTANNYQNKLDVYTPAEAAPPTPVVVVIHGGGWVAGTKEERVLEMMPYLQRVLPR
jgi:acetyl esterase/lipase